MEGWLSIGSVPAQGIIGALGPPSGKTLVNLNDLPFGNRGTVIEYC